MRKRGYISDGRSEEILPLDLSSHSRGEDELEQWIEPRRERVDDLICLIIRFSWWSGPFLPIWVFPCHTQTCHITLSSNPRLSTSKSTLLTISSQTSAFSSPSYALSNRPSTFFR